MVFAFGRLVLAFGFSGTKIIHQTILCITLSVESPSETCTAYCAWCRGDTMICSCANKCCNIFQMYATRGFHQFCWRVLIMLDARGIYVGGFVFFLQTVTRCFTFRCNQIRICCTRWFYLQQGSVQNVATFFTTLWWTEKWFKSLEWIRWLGSELMVNTFGNTNTSEEAELFKW